ncbi:MAG: helix-turn-helix transcriptional regulator [Clostridiaceae bacterium]|nr:helix-turn-helix transcriptional regulator [Clostridiaceae bacterium]
MEQYIPRAAKLLRVISNESKLKILYYLSLQDASVSELEDKTKIEQSNLSHHLRTLKDNHLVKSRRSGKSMIYSLDDHHVFDIIEQVLEHVSHIPE